MFVGAVISVLRKDTSFVHVGALILNNFLYIRRLMHGNSIQRVFVKVTLCL